MRFNRFLLAVVFVASQLVIPRIANASGEEITVQIKFGTLCLTTQQTLNSKVSLANCSVNDSGQLFQIKQFPSLTKVQNGNFCLWAPNYGNGIDLQNTSCKDSYLWNVDSSTLKMTGVSREYCLDIENGSASTGAIAQIWTCLYPAIAAQTFSLVDIKLPSFNNPNRVIIELPSTPSPGSTVSPIDKALTNPWIPAPHRDSARCVDYLFVGFRGSGEQPTGFDDNYKAVKAPWNWSESDFINNVRSSKLKKTPAEDHLGRTLGELYDAVRIRYKNVGKTVGFYSVGVSDAASAGEGGFYLAVPVPTVNWSPWINSVTLDSMNANMGVYSLIRRYRNFCPNTKMLVAGYSQGALMARALTNKMGETSKIEGVILVADPLFSIKDQKFSVAFENDHQMSGIWYSNPLLNCSKLIATAPLCLSLYATIWTEMEAWKNSSSINKITSNQSAKDLLKWSKRVATICDSGDIVCSPVRVVSTPLPPPLNLKIDSDFLNKLLGRELIHTSYGKVSNPSNWWKERVRRWLG